MNAVRNISVKERLERLQRDLKEARCKAVSTVSRGNVCLLQGNFVTQEELKKRRSHAAAFLKKMR